MENRERYKRLIMFLASAVIIAIETLLFAYIWYKFYAHKEVIGRRFDRGNQVVIGLYVLMLYFFYYKLKIFPGPGRLSNSFSAPASVTGMYVIDSLIEGNPAKAMDAVRHLILPSIVLAAFTMGLITRTTRSNLLDALSTDYVRTAKAKGLNSICLILKHALGNALIPVMTVIGLGLGNLLGGMVLVETIFKWPGVGQFAYESVMAADYPAIIGVALLIALNYMIINTVVDILYGIIDPRVRCN